MNIYDIMRKYRLRLPNAHKWRPTPQQWGEIHGIPGSRGKAVCTDGIEVILIQWDGSVFIGHLAHFIPDRQSDGIPQQTKTKAERLLESYI